MEFTSDFLKKQHLDMFIEKRNWHKELMSTLYLDFIKNVDFTAEEKPEVFAGFYSYLADKFKPEIYDGELIVGTCWHWHWSELCRNCVTPGNPGHFVAGFEEFLNRGISGTIDLAESCKSINRDCLKSTLCAFSKYIRKYADEAEALAENSTDKNDISRLMKISSDCYHISEKPPETFSQALQLVWFIQIFLETEANSAAVSFGRADRYLYKYYRSDIENGRITEDDALKLIICFYIKASEGDESQMLTVSGDGENELSILFVRAQRIINMRQPSIGLVISDKTSKSLMEEARKLVLSGGGMPAFFNAGIIKKGLANIGVEESDINDFGIVGCYEAVPHGSFSNTVAGAFNLYDSFSEFVKAAIEYGSFEDFFERYKEYYRFFYKSKIIPKFKETLASLKSGKSPFAACALDGCIQNGTFPEGGGCKYFLFGLNILGIGVLADSIYIVKRLVYDDKKITLSELCRCAENDFDNYDVQKLIKEIKTSYGSDSLESNRLAREISELIYDAAAENPISNDVIVSPGLFWFTADIYSRDYQSTLNGRKKGELFSYGIMPCATPHKNPISSVLLSSANIACDKFPNGCPVMIAVSKADAKKTGFLDAVIKSYFNAGGFHLAINLINADILKQAQQNPEEYSDLIVKISGYSTQFAGLNREIQNAVIKRAEV